MCVCICEFRNKINCVLNLQLTKLIQRKAVLLASFSVLACINFVQLLGAYVASNLSRATATVGMIHCALISRGCR